MAKSKKSLKNLTNTQVYDKALVELNKLLAQVGISKGECPTQIDGGVGSDANACPLAATLADHVGLDDVEVDGEYVSFVISDIRTPCGIEIQDAMVRFPTPSGTAIEEFVSRFDDLYEELRIAAEEKVNDNPDVPADEVLDSLEELIYDCEPVDPLDLFQHFDDLKKQKKSKKRKSK